MTTKEISEFWTSEQMQIIKSMYAKDLNDNEFLAYAMICKRVNLDPLAKQIYAIKRGNLLTIQTSIDGYRLIAERTGKYAPGKDTEYFYDDEGQLLGAKSYVKKQTPDGVWHEFSSTAMLGEYKGSGPIWSRMPHVMIEKCAEARALRKAFPAELCSLYTHDEMQQADVLTNAETQNMRFEVCIPKKISKEQRQQIHKAANQDLTILKAIVDKYKVAKLCEIEESKMEDVLSDIKQLQQQAMEAVGV